MLKDFYCLFFSLLYTRIIIVENNPTEVVNNSNFNGGRGIYAIISVISIITGKIYFILLVVLHIINGENAIMI